jgi:glycogen operon protein
VRVARKIVLTLKREDGSSEDFTIAPHAGEEATVAGPDGSQQRLRRIKLPAQPIGRHRLVLADMPDTFTDLVVAPKQCYLPAQLSGGGRQLGVAAHLYTLRRANDQGIGDFTTLAQVAALSANQGAVMLGLNPLHAMFPDNRERVSPYHASDRRFIDPIYIDVAQLPLPLRGETVRAAIWSEARATNALSALPDVDYARVWQSKKKVLDLAFQAFERLLASSPSTSLAQDFDAFVDAGGVELQRFAEFHAIAEEIGHTQWRDWPDNVRASIRPDRLETSVRYQTFLQWLADRQFASAAAAAKEAGLALGFYRDLAVGSAPDGAESWSDRHRLMTGLSVGAPPDPFSAAGQVWNLPPPNPRFMNENGYQGFSSLIAANMAHAGALRIDHAMGLRRLFVVPDGMNGADGAYVDMPYEDLLGVLALESHRAECLVVGEDLGTVPEGFREALSASDILAYRVLWFERRGNGFVPPSQYPAQAAACVSTHDLATLHGWWLGADIAENETLGFIDAASAEAARAVRTDEKSQLVGLLIAEGALADRPDLTKPMDNATSIAIHTLVAASPSMLAFAQADELTGEIRAVNLPGTDRERPNWRRKLGPDINAMFESPLARGILAGMRAKRGV